jgi:hypothetical protein
VTCPVVERWIPDPSNLNFVRASYSESITKLSNDRSTGNGLIRNRSWRDPSETMVFRFPGGHAFTPVDAGYVISINGLTGRIELVPRRRLVNP